MFLKKNTAFLDALEDVLVKVSFHFLPKIGIFFWIAYHHLV